MSKVHMSISRVDEGNDSILLSLDHEWVVVVEEVGDKEGYDVNVGEGGAYLRVLLRWVRDLCDSFGNGLWFCGGKVLTQMQNDRRVTW